MTWDFKAVYFPDAPLTLHTLLVADVEGIMRTGFLDRIPARNINVGLKTLGRVRVDEAVLRRHPRRLSGADQKNAPDDYKWIHKAWVRGQGLTGLYSEPLLY